MANAKSESVQLSLDPIIWFAAAPMFVGRSLGLPADASGWVWLPLIVLTNGVLCFGFGRGLASLFA
jgi:hypothetical protein